MIRTSDNPVVVGAVVLLLALSGVALAAAPAAALTSNAQTGEQTDATNFDLWWGDDDDGELEFASAEVVGETEDGEVTDVRFQYQGPSGELVKLQVGDETEIKFVTGAEQTATVDVGNVFRPFTEEYPVNVSAEIIGGDACSATVERGDGVVNLCEADEPEPEPAYDLGVSSNSPVTEGETATVEATVENTGDAEGTEDVTVEVADQSTTESVTLGAGESTTVSLDWETMAGDAGTYTATASVADQTASTEVTVTEPDEAEPTPFEGYVAGDEGYLDTNATNPDVDPIEFTECVDFAPTDDALAESPDYLPDPECITIEGTHFPSNNTWQGDVDFPVSISERNNSILGPIYSEAEITTVEGARGTMNRETGEMTLETEVNISIAVYDLPDGHGTPWEDRGSSVVGDSCHIPNVQIQATTGESGDLGGEPLDNDTVTLVDNEFAIDSAQDCQGLAGSINSAQGIPTEPGQSEVVFDFVLEFDEAPEPEPDAADFQIADVSTNSPVTEGENLTVDATVENAGDAEGTQDVELTVDGLGSDSTSLTLGAGDSDTASLSVGTSAGDAGNYTATVSTANDTATVDVSVGTEEPSTGTVEGTVTDNETGEPIEGATVSAGDASATTGPDGNYSLTVEEGDYTVTAEAAGYQSASQDVSVTAGETTTADFSLDSEPTGGTIEGTVTDADTGDAVEDATVSTGAGDSATTGADGSYSLSVDAGEYTVTAEADGYESASQTVDVGAGESATADFSLAPVDEGYSSFTATGQQDGTIVLADDTEDPILIPECDGTTPQDSPEDPVTWEDACFQIDATINDDGTWTAAPEDVNFPWIHTTEPAVDANVTMSAPDGFEGQIDPQDGGMATLEGTLDITVDLGDGASVCSTQTELSATTGSSGSLSGEPLAFDGGDSAHATLVDNQFTVPGLEQTGGTTDLCGAANDEYGLPAETPGENQFELEFLFEFE